jgi:alpha-beta hydrolase superfamily lysophospholipase
MKLSRIYKLWPLTLLAATWIFGLTGCNHLLYPAVREPFMSTKFLVPSPQELTINIPNTDNKSYLHAWYFPAQSKIKKGFVVHFHGNGENLTTHFNYFKWMTTLGFDYLIFDYRGYGQSSDEAATQEKTIQDGLAIFNYIHKQFAPTQLIAIGQSLGSNVLVRTLQELPTNEYPQMVVLDSSFTSYQSAASSALSQRWFLYPLIPLAYLAIDDTFSAEKTYNKTPKIPALFFHGTKDTLIKKENGIENYEKWPGPKALVLNEGGMHTAAFGDPRFVNSNKEIILNCFSFILESKQNQFSNCIKLQK